MPHFDELEILFNERQGNVTHYLFELNRQPEQWQEQHSEEWRRF